MKEMRCLNRTWIRYIINAYVLKKIAKCEKCPGENAIGLTSEGKCWWECPDTLKNNTMTVTIIKMPIYLQYMHASEPNNNNNELIFEDRGSL